MTNNKQQPIVEPTQITVQFSMVLDLGLNVINSLDQFRERYGLPSLMEARRALQQKSRWVLNPARLTSRELIFLQGANANYKNVTRKEGLILRFYKDEHEGFLKLLEREYRGCYDLYPDPDGDPRIVEGVLIVSHQCANFWLHLHNVISDPPVLISQEATDQLQSQMVLEPDEWDKEEEEDFDHPFGDERRDDDF